PPSAVIPPLPRRPNTDSNGFQDLLPPCCPASRGFLFVCSPAPTTMLLSIRMARPAFVSKCGAAAVAAAIAAATVSPLASVVRKTSPPGTSAEPVAWAKVIVDQASDRILGAHIVGHAGEELIHIFAFAMRFGITASQIRETVYAFPTFSADIKGMV